MAKYDTQEIKLTERYKKALHELMSANLEMMRENEPKYAHCWTWSVCEIHDLATASGLEIHSGGEEDRPDYAIGESTILE